VVKLEYPIRRCANIKMLSESIRSRTKEPEEHRQLNNSGDVSVGLFIWVSVAKQMPKRGAFQATLSHFP